MATSRKSKPKTKAGPKRNSKQQPRILCVIFDLDDTLYDCFGQRVRPSHRHAAEAMVKAGMKADVETVYRARMRAYRRSPILRHIDAAVTQIFPVSDPELVSKAARDAYFNCPVGELKLFAGTRPLLRYLHKLEVKIFIVSFGEPAIQQEKVKALGLDREPSVEKIFFADRGNILTKEGAFRQIHKKTRLPASQILVVGDRPSSEIMAGKKLGMHTVRLKRGEFVTQEPQGPEESPDYVVTHIGEVRRLPFIFGKELPTGL
jgi:putative hydrolase of the HAD superfamily